MADSFINIDRVANQLNIKPNMTVADFGAGHGFFSIAFGKIVGPSGKVFSVDVLAESLEAIRSRAKLEGLFNIKIIRGDLERLRGSTLENESCDAVFIANVLFQVQNKQGLISEANRILKKGGELAVIEWKPYIGLGPKKEHRLSEEELKQLVLSAGFSESQPIDVGSHHYGFIFKK